MQREKLRINTGSGASIGELLAMSYRLPKVEDTEVNADNVIYIFGEPLSQEDYYQLMELLDGVVSDMNKIEWF